MKTAKEALAATEAAQARRANAAKERVAKQYEQVMLEVAAAAERGERTIDYRHDLGSEAQRELRANGFKLRDLGENVASIYEISW